MLSPNYRFWDRRKFYRSFTIDSKFSRFRVQLFWLCLLRWVRKKRRNFFGFLMISHPNHQCIYFHAVCFKTKQSVACMQQYCWRCYCEMILRDAFKLTYHVCRILLDMAAVLFAVSWFKKEKKNNLDCSCLPPHVLTKIALTFRPTAFQFVVALPSTAKYDCGG